jgi:hypothetical protein
MKKAWWLVWEVLVENTVKLSFKKKKQSRQRAQINKASS